MSATISPFPAAGSGMRFEPLPAPARVMRGDVWGYCDGWFTDLRGRRLGARVWLAPNMVRPGELVFLDEPPAEAPRDAG